MFVLAVISFTAIPALTGMDRAGAAGDRDAVESSLVFARQRAWASGRPHAVRVDADGQNVGVRWIEETGDPATALEERERALTYDPIQGVTVVSDAGGGIVEIWFNAGGEPLLQEPADDDGDPVSEPVEIAFASGQTLRVIERTGALRW